ncbi:TBC domain-containing protein kinase-like protein isoform X2 [Folsomia candida]|uniref:TBC domain-containing protein kinase-like protein isoform X2 n=1 Tax=Folsomia candida TaxID=158441 RepID=UPI000B8F4E3E|nr:TBC domain-containing protein kinase-like protein isoform X2 [Folsomia candida]
MMEWGRSSAPMGDAHFGVTFYTSSQRQDTCGTNGLPVTPNSIRILGRSQYLKALAHPNLSTYVDIIRGKSERVIIVAEYYEQNIHKLRKLEGEIDFQLANKRALEIAANVLSGLTYLNHHGIVVRNISPETILVCPDGSVKLFNYGLYHMTNCGKYVAFPIGHPKYTAPEVLRSGMKTGHKLCSCDVWSLGIVLIEFLTRTELWTGFRLPNLIKKILDLGNSISILDTILEQHGLSNLHDEISYPVRRLIEKCLEIDPIKREWPEQLLKDNTIFSTQNDNETGCAENGIQQKKCPDYPTGYYADKFLRSSKLLALDGIQNIAELDVSNLEQFGRILPTNPLTERNMNEVYYLWQRAGGDVMAELKRQGLTRKKPAVLSLPHLMTLEGLTHGKTKERGLLLDSTVVILPLHELKKRLNDIPPSDFYPLVEFSIPHLKSDISANKECAGLPLIIRERDIEYQFHRIILFDRLLKGYPYTKSRIYKESLQDIPPYFRAQVWSCLLDIRGDIEHIYDCIDKETATSTDRQIEVDIPRCHQYDELLSSPAGHDKFKRVLKAWVVSNKEYVYWQGLDSLCAPFLNLNFNNEAMAYACLSAFIPKYLYNFFLKDNAVIIQEFLCKFSQLIAFHDPELTNHLDSIGFIPELYAIPWFLTMFSHVFPLHKIFHLWDKLLLGDSSFSLCIGLAILYQLRESLLSSGFNECILLFSDMPEISIEKCVQDSVEIYCSTPKSAIRRKNDPPVHYASSYSDSKMYSKGGGSSSSFKDNGNRPFAISRNNTNHYNVLDALKMDPIPLHELKLEKCARISGDDLLNLLDLNRTKFQKPKIIVIDVRNHEETVLFCRHQKQTLSMQIEVK